MVNPFVPNAPFFYPLKTSENRKVLMFAIYYTSALTAIMVMQVGPICTCVLVIIMKMETIPSLREINGVLRVGITCTLSGAVVVILGSQSNSHAQVI